MKNIKNNIILIGPTGVGKSTLGINLSKTINLSFFDSDNEIEKKYKKSINDIFKTEGENSFRTKEEIIIKEFFYKENIVLSTGAGLIESEKNRYLLPKIGIVIYLKANLINILNRLENSYERPLLNNELYNKKLVLEEMLKKREPLYESISNIIIDTNKKNINQIISDIKKILKIKI